MSDDRWVNWKLNDMMRWCVLLWLLFVSITATAEVDYTTREDVRVFVREMADKHGFTEEGLLTIFSQAQYKQNIIDAISRPAERVLTWAEYQDIFLTNRRIEGGQAFMLANKDALFAAERDFGVPPVVITAIIGVETMYGQITGGFRVLDALTTLAFDYPPRSKFFRGELEHFFLLAREQRQLITELEGSYAGAMGYGQFIPSSYRSYAIDYDKDGVIDIWNNPVDAIGSVANYLSRHGWRRDDQVVVRANVEEVEEKWFNVSLKPSSTVGEMRTLGVATTEEFDAMEAVSPMKLMGKEGPEYWLGFKNFYVITRYNHSKLYAMAVFQLSEALRSADQLALK